MKEVYHGKWDHEKTTKDVILRSTKGKEQPEKQKQLTVQSVQKENNEEVMRAVNVIGNINIVSSDIKI
ncbi:Hypothetical predicted protein, partial [Marmota monax]